MRIKTFFVKTLVPALKGLTDAEYFQAYPKEGAIHPNEILFK
ncbi:MAG: hypothetical protein ACI9IL_000626 [Rickettsiales bacterium]|jgi:hypothetical protein